MASSSNPSTTSASVKAHILDDENWGSMEFNMANLDAVVTAFHFVAHENVKNQGEGKIPPTNHWSLFLTTGSTSSVRLEVAPNDPGEPGMVIIETKKYDVTEKITHKISTNAPEGLTVATVLQLIISKNRDNYVFAPVGEGCRFWLYTLANDFVEAGFIKKDYATQVQYDIGRYWPYPTGTASVDRPMSEGTFSK